MAPGGCTLEVVDPAREEVVGTVPRATAQDVQDALRSAEAGFGAWRQVDAWSRSRLLRGVADLLRQRLEEVAATLTGEMGKPLPEARAEVLAAADHFEWHAEEAKRIYGRVIDGHSREQRLFVLRQPVGPGVEVGPLASWRRLEATERLVADALARGARLECGGRRPPGRKQGFFYEPTVLSGVGPQLALMVEEPFAPVAPIATFTDLADGLAKATRGGGQVPACGHDEKGFRLCRTLR
ncbi:MAG: aldehyde dehydrogenase family protein [Deltaproteobacteria bacterium]|nr:aldehyde dehydrogenase family protein [Deltaproteobacteria bacterium]